MVPQLGWAVVRDNKLYTIVFARSRASSLMANYRAGGSRHRWRIARVRVTEMRLKRKS